MILLPEIKFEHEIGDDHRSDEIVKKEMLDDIEKRFNVIGVFDDRDRVVSMWRENGLQCYQINYGDF